jgi:hypothetical protein
VSLHSSVLGPLQAAVYAALTGNPPFAALATLLDDVPETSPPYPYVTFGEATEGPWDCYAQDGSDATFTLHIWSNYRGFSEAQAINAALIAVLDNNTGLTIAGYGTVLLNYESSQQLRDPDGITRHIATRFRVMADVTPVALDLGYVLDAGATL